GYMHSRNVLARTGSSLLPIASLPPTYARNFQRVADSDHSAKPGVGALEPGGALGISRARLLARLARAQGPLQADHTGCGVGDRAAVLHDGRLQRDLRSSRATAVRWTAVSGVRVLCAAAVAGLLICIERIEQQRRLESTAAHEGVLSQTLDADCGRV